MTRVGYNKGLVDRWLLLFFLSFPLGIYCCPRLCSCPCTCFCFSFCHSLWESAVAFAFVVAPAFFSVIPLFPHPIHLLCKLWIPSRPSKTLTHQTRANPALTRAFHLSNPQIHNPFPPPCGNRENLGTQSNPPNPSFHFPSIPQLGFLKLAPIATPAPPLLSAGFPLFRRQRVLRRGLKALVQFFSALLRTTAQHRKNLASPSTHFPPSQPLG